MRNDMKIPMIRKIMLKKGTKEKTLTEISNWLQDIGKFCANGQEEDGQYYIVAHFEDAVDFLAFCVHIGKAKIISLPDSTGEIK
jgi:hypothetical protein